jgi:diaminopimelate epimerase
MHFYKYHGLGNDYLVLDPAQLPAPFNHGLRSAWVRAICDRLRGIGSDGIVYGPLQEGSDRFARHFACRIWNPDGSEAEVSGNGLRIFARYLLDASYLPDPATVPSLSCLLICGGRTIPVTYGDMVEAPIQVGLGQATIRPLSDLAIPPIEMASIAQLGQPWFVNVGNPHCVFFPLAELPLDRSLACYWGPLIETASSFPSRTNVQFARPLDRHRLAIEIWERGAGYTLASGSSSCAAATAAVAIGHCASPVTVTMPGGVLHVQVEPAGADWYVSLSGPVTAIGCGSFAPGWYQSLLA